MAENFWIYCDFFRNVKTQKLHRRHGDSGVLCLIRLWSAAADGYPDGDLSGKTDEELEIMAGWSNENGLFVRTLREFRFLDGAELYSRLHNWAERQPFVAGRDARIEKARKGGLASARKRSENQQREKELEIARKKKAHSLREWHALVMAFSSRCLSCGYGFQFDKLTKDHVRPLTRTEDPLATDGIDNLQPLCGPCNSRKGNQTTDFRPTNWEERFRAELGVKYESTYSSTPTHSPTEATPNTRVIHSLKRTTKNAAEGQ